MNKPKSFWLSQGKMAESCGISVEAFRQWKVPPVAKIGREVFYSVGDVTNNRVDNLMIGPNSDMAKFDPAIAAYARRRIAELEAQIEASGKS